ncbi:MAG: TIR domain-containing protein [Chloroflexota bacterium]
MDAKGLIIIMLASLGIIVFAVIALWWRSRAGSAGINDQRLSGSSPGAPMTSTPQRQRREDRDEAKKEAAEPPRGKASKPAESAPETVLNDGLFGQHPPPPPPPPPGFFSGASSTEPAATVSQSPAPQPAVEASGPVQNEPSPPSAKPTPPQSVPSDPEPEPQAVEKAAREAEETETEISVPVDEEWTGAQPVPTLPLLDELADWIKEAPPATDATAETRPGSATVDIGASAKAAQSVLFSGYYPKEVLPEKWEPLHAYIFRALASTAVEEDAGKQLGSRVQEFRGVSAPAKADVPEGAFVTATPQMDGFQFNPPSATVGFYKDWHRFDFEVRAKGAPLNQAANGLLTFSVEGIIVADVPLSVYVGETLSTANGQASAVAKAYQAIFCSYSHQDQQIVARAERAYKALGLDYLRDVLSLKSGQDWSDELLNLINKADIFQLFWSHAAAESDHVRSEWEHALQVAGWKANFIRPVYWEDPKPVIPGELKHLHFAYQPDLGS